MGFISTGDDILGKEGVMMSNSLLVLAHQRPEFLWLCLESLRKCRGIEKYPLCVAINESSEPAISSVVNKLCQGLDFEFYIMPKEWLALKSYAKALEYVFGKSDDFVIVVEEDQEVSKDFLELMEYVVVNFREERLFSVIAGLVALPRDNVPSDNELLWVTYRFAMRGYLLFKKPFERYVGPYMCEELYQSETVTALGERSYNRSFVDNAFPEQIGDVLSLDGLIDRVVKHFRLNSLVAVVPRCHVTGFFGVHMRGITEEGVKLFRGWALETRVDFLKSAIQAGALVQFFGQHASEYWDIEDDHAWSRLRVRSEGMY